MSDSNKPTSLVDEILELAQNLVDAHAVSVWDAAAAPIRDRLNAIESELNDLRKTVAWYRPDDRNTRFTPEGYFIDTLGGEQPYGSREAFESYITEQSSEIPRVESHKTLVNSLEQSSALPCSNVSDWDNEDGG